MELLQFKVLVPWFLGMLFGVFVGATPGLTATMAVALIVPITFSLHDPTASLAMIIGVSFTAIFAGDIPATYLRIPGTPASAAATLDGHGMARRGEGERALRLDLICSCLGGMFGVAVLVFLAPQLARFAVRFTDFEYFWLALCGLSLSAVVATGPLRKGLVGATLGLLLSTVGRDIVSNRERFTFGQVDLMDGLGFIPVMIGLFGLSEVLKHAGDRAGLARPALPSGQPVSWRRVLADVWRHKWAVAKSSTAGTVVGALPGAGADIAAWAAYGMAQRTSRAPETFGHGAIEGVVAPTSANNAAVAGAWIPALIFGIPGDAVTAIVLGALLVYDIRPEPEIFVNQADRMGTLFRIAFLTQVLLLPVGYLGIKAFGWILRLPRSVVMTGVVVFCVVGSYALRNSFFDVGLMAAFGVVGLFLERNGVPLGPLILGLILGPMVEENLRTGLIKSEGSLVPFVTRPLCLVMVAVLVLVLFGPWLWRRWMGK